MTCIVFFRYKSDHPMTPDPRMTMFTGRTGKPYEKHHGFCLETQRFPDVPRCSDFHLLGGGFGGWVLHVFFDTKTWRWTEKLALEKRQKVGPKHDFWVSYCLLKNMFGLVNHHLMRWGRLLAGRSFGGAGSEDKSKWFVGLLYGEVVCFFLKGLNVWNINAFWLDGCFLKSWYPQNTPKWSFLVGKPMVVGYQHFRKPPDRDGFGGCTLSYLVCFCIIGYIRMGLDALFFLSE